MVTRGAGQVIYVLGDCGRSPTAYEMITATGWLRVLV